MKAPQLHTLKTLPQYFDAVKAGIKTAELRVNDRNYRVGDILCLQKYTEQRGYADVEPVIAIVTHIVTDEFNGLAAGFVMLSFKLLEARA